MKIDRKFSWFYLLKVSFSGHFLTYTPMLLDAPQILIWGHGPDPTWSFEIKFGSNGIPSKNLDLFSIFLTNRVCPNQAKSWKWAIFKTLLCQPPWFQMYVWYVILKVHIVRYNLDQIFFSKFKTHTLPNYEQTDLKTAIVAPTRVQGKVCEPFWRF